MNKYIEWKKRKTEEKTPHTTAYKSYAVYFVIIIYSSTVDRELHFKLHTLYMWDVSCDTIKTLRKEMKKKIARLFTYCFFVTTIFSCSSHYKLKKDDIKYIPYKGSEVLVYQSDKNRMDTIFLKGISNFNGCVDPLAIFPDKCDGIVLNCTRTDPNYDRYLEGKKLVEIVATSNNETHISFDIVLKGSWFYNMDSYGLSEFDKMPNSELTINNKVYKDVKIFEAGDYAKQYELRDNYSERFYWSLSQGFLGLDRRDEKWRLIKKYEP